jgi:lysozyme family protein
MAANTYDESLRRLLVHEGGYTDHPADPGGPTNFGITIYDYRKYVKPGASAVDVRAMKVDEAKAIYRAKYWDAQRCNELPAGVDYAVFDYGVNSGIGRSGKVLRRALKLPDNTSTVNDAVIAAARAANPKVLIGAICDERLRFLQSLKTWGVFGAGWGRRVVEVKALANDFADHAADNVGVAAPVVPPQSTPLAATPGKGVVPVASGASRGSAGAIAAAGAACVSQAHASGAHPVAILAIIVVTLALALGGWMFWQRRQQRQQEYPA